MTRSLDRAWTSFGRSEYGSAGRQRWFDIAPSDRTVRIWSQNVSLCFHIRTSFRPACVAWSNTCLGYFLGGFLHALNLDHPHWDSTLNLSTNFTFQTGAFDPIPEYYSSDEGARSLAFDDMIFSPGPPGNCLGISGSDEQAFFL